MSLPKGKGKRFFERLKRILETPTMCKKENGMSSENEIRDLHLCIILLCLRTGESCTKEIDG
jgi:hypothetical protein